MKVCVTGAGDFGRHVSFFFHFFFRQALCVFVQDVGKGGPAGQATEGMLANFFNSLLNKKTGAAVAGKGRSAKPHLSRCVILELKIVLLTEVNDFAGSSKR